jgi:hypothetical protein
MMSEGVFKESLIEIIKVIKRGVGISTRAGAANFIVELSLERKDMFTPQQAKRVCNTCLDILKDGKSKESLVKIICGLYGSMFRVFGAESYDLVREQFDLIKVLSEKDET